MFDMVVACFFSPSIAEPTGFEPQELDQDKKGTIQLHELRTVLEDRFDITDEETRKTFAALDASNHEDGLGANGGVTSQNQGLWMEKMVKNLVTNSEQF